MKYFVIITIVLVSIACQVNFDPNNHETVATPVVYCILNLNDSIQYVRLSGTFSPNQDELSDPPYSAKTWNETVEIYMEENGNDGETSIYFFDPVDDVPAQDSGLFETPSFRLYQSQMTPRPETRYRLYVFLDESGTHCFSETTTVGLPTVLDPARLPGREITFSAYDDYLVHYYTPAHSTFQVAWFSFGDWVFWKNQYGSPQKNGRFLTFSSERFFAELSPDADFSFPEFNLTCFGEELALYNQLIQGSSKHFTPLNFNSITNGAGLFSSSINLNITNLVLSEHTLELIDQHFTFSGNRYIDFENSPVYGQLSFHFIFPPSVLPADKIHRTELKLAYTADSLYKGLFFAEANVSDTREEYNFILPAGDYYYQAGITCSCLADSCLWDGFPNGQFGRQYAINQFTVTAGQSLDEKPLFQ